MLPGVVGSQLSFDSIMFMIFCTNIFLSLSRSSYFSFHVLSPHLYSLGEIGPHPPTILSTYFTQWLRGKGVNYSRAKERVVRGSWFD